MERIPITKEGYIKLKEELRRLKTIERRSVIEDIKEARSFGDLSENAEYDAAKEKQGFIEARISELESKMTRLEVIDVLNHASDKVTFGATVEIENMDTGEIKRYKLVGPDESDIKKNRISILSPIARALIGKKTGDEAIVNSPAGEVEYEIKSIKYE
ncbi:MAG: transcription elongation factor GreA [Deferribacterota bacterium]|nr:transcription elongation factor GreA [Deferribacterota bacterium]